MKGLLVCASLVVVSLQAMLPHGSHVAISTTCPSNSTVSCCIRQCQDTCLGTSTSLCSRSHRCVPGCACHTGFVRHGAQCVKRRKCSRLPMPLPNTDEADQLRKASEEPIGCPGNFTATCSPQTCHFTCGNHTLLAIGTLFCKPGAQLLQPVCVCLSGYVRKAHQCVLPAECPPIPKSSVPDSGPPDSGRASGLDVTVNPSIYSPPPNLPRPTAFAKDGIIGIVSATTTSFTEVASNSNSYPVSVLFATRRSVTSQPGPSAEGNSTSDWRSAASQTSLNRGLLVLILTAALFCMTL